MRIEEGRIQSFGPFGEATLALPSGMTVIFGPNEAGKSTWHAALYAALCGIRRARGAVRAEDREFAERHRPWHGDAWQTSAVIKLEDGRRIEIRQDLDGKVDCRAIDLATGQDVSSEIINEGTPDASRWLGLDRRTFLATACVRQTEILAVSANPEELQESLQRAAATAGADETAARALALLEQFQKEHIGLDRAGGTKPLKRALDHRQQAEHTLVVAKRAHEEHVNLASEAERLEMRADEAAASVRMREAALASREAREWEGKLDRARQLSARDRDLPSDLPAHDELGQAVATALKAWTDMPALPELNGPTSADLRRQLESLPIGPAGDVEPHPEVLSARNEVDGVRRALALCDNNRSPDPENLQLALGEEELRDLARDLDGGQTVEGYSGGRGRTAALVAAVVVVLAGGVAVVLGYVGQGLLAIGVGAVLGAWTLLRGERLARHRTADDERARRRAEAVARAAQFGLPTESGTLREVATRLAEVRRRTTAMDDWKRGREALQQNVSHAEFRLTQTLASRNARSFDEYSKGCSQRLARAQEASRRPDLEKQVVACETLERVAQNAYTSRKRAAMGVREVARRCGIDGQDDALIATALRDWQQAHAASVKKYATALQEQAELDAILGDYSLEAFEAACKLRRQLANQLIAALPAEQRSAAELLEHDAAEDMRELRTRTEKAAELANQARGQISDRARSLASVPEAEEELALAVEELARVQALDDIIKTTQQFLQRAQERVHRDIAPVLAGTLKEFLPRVTTGRYADAMVDPQSLTVKISASGGPWREAHLLSQGTREQVYLLLRMAMAQHLAAINEVCPLLFDEVTVQGDSSRTAAVLGLLHEISRERQVILFTQEDHIQEWAREHLHQPQDKLIVLDGII